MNEVSVEIIATSSNVTGVVHKAYEQADVAFGHDTFKMKQYGPISAFEKSPDGDVFFWEGTFIATGTIGEA